VDSAPTDRSEDDCSSNGGECDWGDDLEFAEPGIAAKFPALHDAEQVHHGAALSEVAQQAAIAVQSS